MGSQNTTPFLLDQYSFKQQEQTALVYQNPHTGHQAECHYVSLPHNQVTAQLEFYQLRVKLPHEHIVRIFHSAILYPSNNPQNPLSRPADPNKTILRVFTERIATRLGDYQRISFRPILTILKQVLLGFQVLFNRFGAVQVCQDMIGFSPSGIVKVWINPNFLQNHPTNRQEGLVRRSQSQGELVDNILGVLDKFLKQKNQSYPRFLTFRQALLYIAGTENPSFTKKNAYFVETPRPIAPTHNKSFTASQRSSLAPQQFMTTATTSSNHSPDTHSQKFTSSGRQAGINLCLTLDSQISNPYDCTVRASLPVYSSSIPCTLTVFTPPNSQSQTKSLNQGCGQFRITNPRVQQNTPASRSPIHLNNMRVRPSPSNQYFLPSNSSSPNSKFFDRYGNSYLNSNTSSRTILDGQNNSGIYQRQNVQPLSQTHKPQTAPSKNAMLQQIQRFLIDPHTSPRLKLQQIQKILNNRIVNPTQSTTLYQLCLLFRHALISDVQMYHQLLNCKAQLSYIKNPSVYHRCMNVLRQQRGLTTQSPPSSQYRTSVWTPSSEATSVQFPSSDNYSDMKSSQIVAPSRIPNEIVSTPVFLNSNISLRKKQTAAMSINASLETLKTMAYSNSNILIEPISTKDTVQQPGNLTPKQARFDKMIPEQHSLEKYKQEDLRSQKAVKIQDDQDDWVLPRSQTDRTYVSNAAVQTEEPISKKSNTADKSTFSPYHHIERSSINTLKQNIGSISVDDFKTKSERLKSILDKERAKRLRKQQIYNSLLKKKNQSIHVPSVTQSRQQQTPNKTMSSNPCFTYYQDLDEFIRQHKKRMTEDKYSRDRPRFFEETVMSNGAGQSKSTTTSPRREDLNSSSLGVHSSNRVSFGKYYRDQERESESSKKPYSPEAEENPAGQKIDTNQSFSDLKQDFAHLLLSKKALPEPEARERLNTNSEEYETLKKEVSKVLQF